MLYVIKFGGNAISGKEDMLRLSQEIAIFRRKKIDVVIIHGGGPEISAEMQRRGLDPVKIAGQRVTDESTLEVVDSVLSKINTQMRESLEECSVPAIGMPGYMCTLCKRRGPQTVKENGKEFVADLGLVGDVIEVDSEMLNDLLNKKIVPVIYPIGADEGGNHLNVNADTMAAGIASAMKCKELIAITDVPGILRDVKDMTSKIDRLTLKEIDELIEIGVISGGMIPKVEACRDALNAGAEVVRMVNGKDEKCILTDLIKDVPIGTIIVK